MKKIKVEMEVEKIYSYQTLIYKNGARTFPKPRYKKYKQEMGVYLKDKGSIEPNKPIRLNIHYCIEGGLDLPTYAVKRKDTDNTSRVFKSLEDAEKFFDKDIHYIEERKMEVKFGVVGDNDNITKPILDTLEEYEIFENDRFVVDGRQTKSFGHKENKIIIEVEELEPKLKNGIAYFE